MKPSFLLLTLLLCTQLAASFISPGCGQSRTAAIPEPKGKEISQPLKLTMSIVSLKYCKGDTDLDGVQINLRLTFVNTGQQSLILYKHSSQIERIMVSRNIEDAAAQKYEINSSLTHVTARDNSDKRISKKMARPNDLFVILAPEEVYNGEATAGIFVTRSDTSSIKGAVSAGEHVLEVEVSTWPESEELARELRNRWRQIGLLLYEPVLSAPIQFRIDKEREVVECR